MKKLLFSLLTFLLVTTIAISQESDPKKALAKASRALSAFNLDPSGNENKLEEAKNLIEIAAASDAVNGQFKTWQTRGNIYNSFADKDLGMMSVAENPEEYSPKYPDAPFTAAESFEKALKLAEKKYEKKDATVGLKDASQKLNQLGNLQISQSDYGGAFKSLNKVFEANKKIIANGEEAVIKAEEMGNHKFVMAFCAKASNNNEMAKALFKEIYEGGTEEATVYAQYANILIEEDNEEGDKILDEGLAKFPDNTELLFAKINQLIKAQKYKQLEEVLMKAIEAEPNNPSVRSALGNVYMNLFTEEFEKDMNSTLAQEYFEKAMDYFDQAVDIDPKQFDALYSMGSLYFNKAVAFVKFANELPIDKPKEYEEATKTATSLMEQALPFFKKAESINANDNNTLIALSEIFARMNEFDKSKEFKSRLETIKAGGANESSYFSN